MYFTLQVLTTILYNSRYGVGGDKMHNIIMMEYYIIIIHYHMIII